MVNAIGGEHEIFKGIAKNSRKLTYKYLVNLTGDCI